MESRPLNPGYPVIFLDALVCKVRQWAQPGRPTGVRDLMVVADRHLGAAAKGAAQPLDQAVPIERRFDVRRGEDSH